MQTVKEFFLFSGYMLLQAVGLFLLALTMRYIIWAVAILLVISLMLGFLHSSMKALFGSFWINETLMGTAGYQVLEKKKLKFTINKAKLPKLRTVSCKETFRQEKRTL